MKNRQSLLMISVVALTVVGLSACGNKGSSGSPAPAAPPVSEQTETPNLPTGYFSYAYSETLPRRCETGLHSFNTLAEMCQALLNESLNQNCARLLRENDHFVRCRGIGGGSPLPQLPVVQGPFRNIWCSVAARDHSGRFGSFFNNRGNRNFLNWDSRQRRRFALPFGNLSSRFGEATLILHPAEFGQGPGSAEIVLTQKKGERQMHRVRGSLSQPTRLFVEDPDMRTSIQIECMQMESAAAATFIAPAPSRISCQGQYGRGRDAFRFEESFQLNASTSDPRLKGQSKAQRPDGLGLKLELRSGFGSDAAMISVEGFNGQDQRRIVGSGSVRQGFEFVTRDRDSDFQIQLQCRPL